MARRFKHLDRCASTNAFAREQVECGAWRDDVVVWTDDQPAGRGTRGRTWVMPPKRALALSIVVDAAHLERISRLTILSAVAVRRALAHHGCDDIELKWPNDVMRGERKVGGILAEAARTPAGENLYVVGVGVNLALRPGDVPGELESRVGDVGLDASAASRLAYATSIAVEIDASLADVGTPADAARSDEYRACSWILGRTVALTTRGGEITGTVTDVSGDGDLWVDGERHAAETTRLVRVE